MTDDSDIQEINVQLSQFDMDHLSEGQPVFKVAGDETRLVLRFDEFQEWHRVPIAELEQLADEWEKNKFAWDCRGKEGSRAFEYCAQELREVLEQYE